MRSAHENISSNISDIALQYNIFIATAQRTAVVSIMHNMDGSDQVQDRLRGWPADDLAAQERLVPRDEVAVDAVPRGALGAQNIERVHLII